MANWYQPSCSSYDPQTNECMRRFERCTCNPPRCICGRFVKEWGDMHPECVERVRLEMPADEFAEWIA